MKKMKKPIIIEDILNTYICPPINNYYPYEGTVRKKIDPPVIVKENHVTVHEGTIFVTMGLRDDDDQQFWNWLYPMFLLKLPKIEKLTPETDVAKIFADHNKNNLRLMYEVFTAVRQRTFTLFGYRKRDVFFHGVSWTMDTTNEKNIDGYSIFAYVKPAKKEFTIVSTPVYFKMKGANCAIITSILPLRRVVRMEATSEVFKLFTSENPDRQKAIEVTLNILKEKNIVPSDNNFHTESEPPTSKIRWA